MPRPPKPTAILELSGSFKTHPERRRHNEPVDSRGIGECPDRLPDEMRPYWDEIVTMAAPGVLKISDRWAVELAARLMHKAVNGPNIPAIRRLVKTLKLTGDAAAETVSRLIKIETIASAELSTLRSLIGGFGYTPADRSKLSIAPEKKQNRFSGFVEAPVTRPN